MALSQIVRAASSRLISWPHAAAYQAFNGKHCDEGIRSLLLEPYSQLHNSRKNWNQEKELVSMNARSSAAASSARAAAGPLPHDLRHHFRVGCIGRRSH